jgi:hypothetical protein
MGGYGFSSLNRNLAPQNNNTGLLEVSSLSNIITAVRVIYILLDDSDPVKFKKYDGWDGLGTIEYELVTSPGTTSTAYPLYSNLKNYPLINEIVYTISFPSNLLGKANTSERKYYLNTVNLWNHPHHNAYPSIANEPDPPQQKDYIQTQLGSAKIVTNKAKQISLGKTFYERSNIHPLLPFEGDVIQEGRWGNSIRLGSTVAGSPSPTITNNWSAAGMNGDPITIIRNGQGKQTKEGWIPITENINNDSSSIYLTSTQKIPLETSSTSYLSYSESGLESPIIPNEYEGKQIILSSGRLVFNSNTDHILLSSKKSINLNSTETITADTRKFIIKSDNIYLGPESLAKEPLLKGDATVKVLRELSSCIKTLTLALQNLTSDPVTPFTPATFTGYLGPIMTSLSVNLNAVDKQLNNLTSKNNYTT